MKTRTGVLLLLTTLSFNLVHAQSPEDSPQAALAALFQSGDARLTRGSAEDFARFFSYFEPMSSEPIALTIR